MKFEMEFVLEECYSCRMPFLVSAAFQKNKKADKSNFWCPNGHSQAYQGKTEAQKLREDWEASSLRFQSELNEANHARLVAEKAAKAEKTKRWKVSDRIAKGVCPCCNRTFEDLARHMPTKHKDYALPPADKKKIEGLVE